MLTHPYTAVRLSGPFTVVVLICSLVATVVLPLGFDVAASAIAGAIGAVLANRLKRPRPTPGY